MLPSLVWLLCLDLPRPARTRLASPRLALPCFGIAVTFAVAVAMRRQSYRKRQMSEKLPCKVCNVCIFAGMRQRENLCMCMRVSVSVSE